MREIFTKHNKQTSKRRAWRLVAQILLGLGALAVIAILVWQGVTAHGTPDPTQPRTSPTVAFLDIAVLVFREGLECILVLAAITASMTGSKRAHRRPVAWGAAVAFGVTLITWFIAVRIMSHLTESVPALDLQAATGLLAVVVLLIIMNWFFHKIYWGGWIRAHNRRRKALLSGPDKLEASSFQLQMGLVLLGFTSLYREGFEVVLFLQSYNLRLGGGVVFKGALLGLILTSCVAVLTFVLQARLPYRKMLITTGILLGVVLLVMVGEEAQEMQLAHWLPTTEIAPLVEVIPGWMGLWFAVFPTVETLAAQVLAAILVIGSYYAAQWRENSQSHEAIQSPTQQAVVRHISVQQQNNHQPKQNKMKTINIAIITAAAIAALGIVSCSKMESKLKLSDLPPAAQATIKAKVGDATIEEIEKETEKGKIVYQVEAKKDGTKIEFKVDDTGKIVEKD